MNPTDSIKPRREFNRQLVVLGAAALPTALSGTLAMLSSPAAQAQGPFAEGRDYARLSTPAPVPGHGKIDVLEFFWYGCPHCNALEPTLEAWTRKLPADVVFRRVPVVFSALHEGHARMYYALEALGQLEMLHRRIFAALHVQRRRLDKEDEMAAFVAENGVDRAKFSEAFASFNTGTKVRQSKQLAEAYKIDGVPSLGIHGRFLTAGHMAGSNERALAVADFLIEQSRRKA